MADAEVVLYRMVLPDHVCPYGVRAKQLLEDAGHGASTTASCTPERRSMRFQEEHGVDTTPQVFIDGERIGGSDDLDAILELAGATPDRTSAVRTRDKGWATTLRAIDRERA